MKANLFNDSEIQYLINHKRGVDVVHRHYQTNTDEFLETLKEKMDRIPYKFDWKMIEKKLEGYG